MAELKVISQRNWIKGLQATFGQFSQPQGIITRMSNLMYDKRGSLRQADGSEVFLAHNGAPQPADGPITDFFLYSPAGVDAYYVGTQISGNSIGTPAAPTLTQYQIGAAIASASTSAAGILTVVCAAAHGLPQTNSAVGNNFNYQPSITGAGGDITVTITAPTPAVYTVGLQYVTIIDSTSFSFFIGGSGVTASAGSVAPSSALAPGNYSFAVAADDGIGGETAISAAATINLTSPNNAIAITGTDVPLAFGYSVFVTASSEATGRLNPSPLATVIDLSVGVSYFGNPVYSGAPLPVNTTRALAIYQMTAPSYNTVLGYAPPSPLPMLGGIPGAVGGIGGGSAGEGPNPQGGVLRGTCPLPVLLQFANSLVLALGNGYPPQVYQDPSVGGSGAGVLQTIQNAFNSQYPDWQPSVSWVADSQILDSVSGGIFTATQAGTSGATRPTFNNQVGATTHEVSPGTAIWTCVAVSYTPTPLRGAACACVYAGALWLANTYPISTSDDLDGPDCLKMSNLNTVGQWNPVNVAFLNKDDGDQITCLATFTIAEAGISPTGSLVAFKNFSTFQITGVFGAADFAIQQAQTDLGCIAGRSTTFVPGYGLARLTHLGFAYFDGVNDKLISEEIRPYLFGGEDDIQPIDWNYAYLTKGAQSVYPPMYLAACPLVITALTGFTFLPGTAPGATQLYIYLRATKLVMQPNGSYEETAITEETTIISGSTSFIVTSPAAAAGIQYRVYAGLTQNNEDLYIQQNSFTAQTVMFADMSQGAPSVGAGALTRIFCYDLVQKQWAIVDLPFPISALKQIRAPGTQPVTAAAGWSDGQVRRMFGGDVLWDTGAQVQWSFTGQNIFQDGASSTVFYRRIIMRAKVLKPSIKIAVNLEGNPVGFTNETIATNLGSTQWYFRMDIMQDAENASVTVSGAGAQQIEVASVDWHVRAKATGRPPSIQK